MKKSFSRFKTALSCSVLTLLASCANMNNPYTTSQPVYHFDADYGARLPQHMNTKGKKMILIDPNVHAWGAYSTQGNLIRAGIATSGGAVCPPDADEADCRTGSGTFHITTIRGAECASKTYPRPHGGGLMPYCMFFNGGQALHGSPDDIIVEDNISHGCVRMRIPDAQWMTSNFAQIGTTIKVVPY